MSISATLVPQGRLSVELEGFLVALDGKDTTVGELIGIVGDRGFGLLLLLLALPAALPLPATGYGTPFGLVMTVLGAQLLLGRSTIWLPEVALRRRVPYRLLEFSVRNAGLPLKAVELLIRPRLGALARSPTFLRGIGAMIVLLALLLALPVPLTNTAPSFVIFLLAAGMLEEDGLFLLGGLLLAPVAVGIAGTALYYAAIYGPEAVDTTLKPLIRETLGLG